MTLAHFKTILEQSAALGVKPTALYVNPATVRRTPRMKQIEALCAERGIKVYRNPNVDVGEWKFWEENA